MPVGSRVGGPDGVLTVCVAGGTVPPVGPLLGGAVGPTLGGALGT
jgi:hypothetical protein